MAASPLAAALNRRGRVLYYMQPTRRGGRGGEGEGRRGGFHSVVQGSEGQGGAGLGVGGGAGSTRSTRHPAAVAIAAHPSSSSSLKMAMKALFPMLREIWSVDECRVATLRG